jgi:MFS family permease
VVRQRLRVVAGLVEVGEFSMKIGLDIASLKESRWYEYAVRFFFGGIITAATGEIARKFGPEVAGLFLAFPAIFPATGTMIEKHEKQKMEEAGLQGTRRGRALASVDAAGAAMGALGLIAFGALVRRMLPQHSTWLVLGTATLLWLAIAISVWVLRKSIRKPSWKRKSKDDSSS